MDDRKQTWLTWGKLKELVDAELRQQSKGDDVRIEFLELPACPTVEEFKSGQIEINISGNDLMID